jgi:conjugal transfer/type IV secretion protein DotA/TraY
MLGMTRRELIKYSFLPGIAPRLKDLFISGFQLVPFYMALVYQAVRLLPLGHPYTKTANIGKFGIRHVIGEAANNLVFSRKNIDQIILFVTLLVGVVALFVEIALLGVAFLAGPVMAAPLTFSFTKFFVTEKPAQDLAMMMFDLIFGIPSTAKSPGNIQHMFGSCFNPAVGEPCKGLMNKDIGPLLEGPKWPLPIHEGLHAMFQTYNSGLLIVAFFITIYFITTVLLETAQTGTPFGKRFNKVWAPIRLVVAFGLLIPFSTAAGGLNSSQYIVLYAAKLGSGFATNGWNLFNTTLTGTPLGEKEKLLSKPGIPEINGLLQFMYSAGICYEMEEIRKTAYIRMYAVKDNVSPDSALLITSEIQYQDLIDFANGDRQVILRFGEKNDKDYADERGHVRAICGELVIPLSDPRNPDIAKNPNNAPEKAAVIMQAYYFALIYELWFTTLNAFKQDSGRGKIPDELAAFSDPDIHNFALNTMRYYTQWDRKDIALAPLPPQEYKTKLQEFYAADLQAVMTGTYKEGKSIADRGINGLDSIIGTKGAIPEAVNSPNWAKDSAFTQKGWAAAGIWYNRVAELNGLVTTAMLSIPIPTRFPMVMENIRAANIRQNQQVSIGERYKPSLSGGLDYTGEGRPQDQQQALALWKGFEYWQTGGGATTTHTAPTGNPIMDTINQIFGTSGLYSLRKNPEVHPLAQLVGVGRSLVEAATRDTILAVVSALGGATIDPFGGAVGAIGVSMMMTIVTIALTMGFILYYVLPFLPFVYFFFAVGGWFKAIFEAMVGAPLWALAHLRIDGNGLSGQAAINGYFLIFEIFLRPILIIFGLLASISIFAAQVYILNNTWDLVTANLSGFDVASEETGVGTSLVNYFRGPIDEFFFTVIYSIIVYIMGLNSFKLIDRIPNGILKWMGHGVKLFNDEDEHAGDTLSGTAYFGGQQAISGLGGSTQKFLEKASMKFKGP